MNHAVEFISVGTSRFEDASKKRDFSGAGFGALAPVVESLVSPLFELFSGMRFESVVVEGIVNKTLAERY